MWLSMLLESIIFYKYKNFQVAVFSKFELLERELLEIFKARNQVEIFILEFEFKNQVLMQF